jgi:RNA polymerase sigma-70 factor (ECF subfamily)
MRAAEAKMALVDEMLALVPKLRAHAWVLTHGAPDADDLVQETLARAWQFRHTFQPGTNLKAWMYRILRNVFLASVSGKLRTIQDVDGKFAARLSQEAAQDWSLRFGELMGRIALLPEQHAEALLLVAGSGLTYEEAAEVCFCSVGTIKSRVSRARERLAEFNVAETEAAAPTRAGETSAARAGSRRGATARAISSSVG